MPVIPSWAEMVLGELWSGWGWEEAEGVHRFRLCYRLQDNDKFAFRTFKTWDDLNQFCDGLEGDTDEFLRD